MTQSLALSMALARMEQLPQPPEAHTSRVERWHRLLVEKLAEGLPRAVAEAEADIAVFGKRVEAI